jgi:hypothetical protein
MRSVRELEPPSIDEGFAEVEQVPFARCRRRRERESVYRRGRRAQGLRLAGAWLKAIRQRRTRLRLEPGRTDALAPDVARLAADVAAPVAKGCAAPARPAELPG